MMPSKNFKFNCILECEDCPVRDNCPISDENDGYCGWELEDYETVMNALSETMPISETHKAVAEILIANILVAKRGLRELKFNGLSTKMVTKKGTTIDVENPIKQGIHLEFNRIIRLLKELRATPKEKTPSAKKGDVQKMLQQITKNLQEVKG